MPAPLAKRGSQFLNRITTESCDCLFIGDSTASISSPRWTRGIIRTWDVPWVGLFAHNSSSDTTEGWTVFSNNGTDEAPGAAVTGGGTNDCMLASKTSDFSVWAGFNGYSFGRFGLSSLDTYLNGDWTETKALRARILLRRVVTGEQADMVAVDHRRSNTNSNTNIYPSDFSIGSNYGAKEIDFAAAPGEGSDVFHLCEITMLSGNCYPNTTPPGIHSRYGVQFYAPGSTGFNFVTMGQSGSNTRNWLIKPDEPAGLWTSTQIANYLGMLVRPINTLIIQLGINLAAGEGSDTAESQAIYKANVEAVIDEWRSHLESAGALIGDIRVLLIAPWEAHPLPGADSQAWPNRRAQALYDLANERSYVSFVNLNQLMIDAYGPWSTWQGTYLADGVHQSAAGAEEFAQQVWDALSLPDPEQPRRRSRSLASRLLLE